MLQHPRLQPTVLHIVMGILPGAFALGAVGCHGVPTHSSLSPMADVPALEAGLANASAPIGMGRVEHVLIPKLQEPAMHTFFSVDPQVVGYLTDDHQSRYVKLSPQCSFVAYDSDYLEQRQADPRCEVALRTAIQALISTSSLAEIIDPDAKNDFHRGFERTAERILFPVHIGTARASGGMEPQSGLQLGDSQQQAGTFRGQFHDHVLRLDGVNKTLQLDDGPVLHFEGDEPDLHVLDANGHGLYVDVSTLDANFVGEFPVGVKGRVRQVFLGDRIIQ